jgi:pimeloyl-ACP methyl ester carboxylesterase
MPYHGADGCLLYAYSFGAGPATVLLHGGGPDHRSLLPLATQVADASLVVLPDLRGFGRSVCTDPACFTWARYTEDFVALIDHLGLPTVSLVGTGLGSTIALRVAAAHPDRVNAMALISVEDIEDDEAKAAEVAFFQAFAARLVEGGPHAAWAPVLPALTPLIGTLVREAMPRSDPASLAAFCAIGHDRAFRNVDDLRSIDVPALVIAGADARHPTRLAAEVARALPRGCLASSCMSAELRTAEDLAEAVGPELRRFFIAHAAW